MKADNHYMVKKLSFYIIKQNEYKQDKQRLTLFALVTLNTLITEPHRDNVYIFYLNHKDKDHSGQL